MNVYAGKTWAQSDGTEAPAFPDDLKANKAATASIPGTLRIMQKQSRVVTSILLFVLSAGGGPLVAASQVDQQQPVIDIAVGSLAIGGDSQQKLAQVVTAGISGLLTEVRFPIACHSADLIIDIEGVTDGKPNGIVLNSETFAGGDLPVFSPDPPAFRGFAFAGPTFFSAGEHFAIVLRSTGTTALEGCGILQGPAGESYAGGEAFFDARPNPEGVWVCLADFEGGGFDVPFQTVVGPPVIQVGIDIRPGEFPNNINRKSRGKVPVAILSRWDFDAATQVDRSSLTFGSTGDEPSLAHCEPADVNGDGLSDLLCHFNAQPARFNPNDGVGILKGRTVGGTEIRGTDAIRIIH